MDMRDWLSIIVIIAIIVILVDGFRRRGRSRDSIRMKLDKSIPAGGSAGSDSADELPELEEEVLSELPNGPARIRKRGISTADDPVWDGGSREGAVRDYEADAEQHEYDDDPDESDISQHQPPEEPQWKEPVHYGDRTTKPANSISPAEDFPGHDNAEETDLAEQPDEDETEQTFVDEHEVYSESDEGFDDYGSDEPEEEYTAQDSAADKDYGRDYENDEDDPLFGDDPGHRIEPTFSAFDDEILDEELDEVLEKELGGVSDSDDEPEPELEPVPDTEPVPEPEPESEKEPEYESESESEPEPEPQVAAARSDSPRSRFSRNKPDRKTAPRRTAAVMQNELDLDHEGEEDEAEETEEREVEEVIVINVMARPDQFFKGDELLPVLKSQGMKLGKFSIFHRHAEANGNGPVMFSMANMVKPGNFDMASMDSFTTPGVSLFMQLPGNLDNMQTFDQMLETANALKSALDGELKDEDRSVLTRQTIEHCRQRVRDFQLRQLSRR